MRIRGAKTELEEAGESTEGMAESTATMRKEIMALSGVDIMASATEFKSTYQIMDELAGKWEGLSDIAQASIIELMAGKHQGNVFSSLMANFDTAREALEVSANSAGSAMQEHAKWSESLEARLLKLKATWQSFSQSFMNSKFLKVSLNIITEFINFLDILIDKIGVIPTLLGGFAAFKIFKAFKTTNFVGGIKSIGDVLKVLTNAFPMAASGVSKLASALGSMAGASGSAGGALSGLIGLLANPYIATATVAVGALTAAFVYQKKQAEELAKKVEETVSSYREQHDALMDIKDDYDTSKEDSMISKYGELSKGVDGLGRNVSLTAQEYAEYQDIVNTIAGQIPSLVSGYDEQGNALLSCKGNVEALTEAYEKLVHAQNQDILTNTGNIEKDFENTLKDAEKGSFFGMGKKVSNPSIELLEKVLNGNYSTKEIENLLNGMSLSQEDGVYEALYNAGIGDMGRTYTTKEVAKTLSKQLKEDRSKIKGIIDDHYSQFADDIEEQKTIAQAVLSEAFDVSSVISGLDYGNISEELQSIAQQTVSSLDYSFFEELSKNGKSVEQWTKEMLSQLNSLSDVDNKQIEAGFELQTKFNGGDISYGEYVGNLKNIESTIDGLDLKDEVKEQLKLSLNTEDILTDYTALVNNLKEIGFDDNAINDFLDSLSVEEYSAAMTIIPDLDAGATISEIQKLIDDKLATEFTFDITVETESITALNTALSEARSATGLTAESITALKGRYEDLEGFNAEALFERTANGVRVNNEELARLEAQYENVNKLDIDKNLNNLITKYQELTEEIKTCTDEQKKESLQLQADTYADKIEELQILSSQYDGLTSAFSKWQNAQSSANDGDNYDSLYENFKEIKELYKKGLVGTDDFKTAAQLMTSKDLSTASIDEIVSAYEKGYPKMQRYFTEGQKGCKNFLNDVSKLNSEWAHMNKDGSWEINFNVEEVAKELGTSVDSVLLIANKLRDYGFEVNLEDSSVDSLQTKIEKTEAKLKKLGQSPVDINVDIEADSKNIKTIESEIEKAKSKISEINNSSVKPEVKTAQLEDAQAKLESLIQKKQEASQPAFMNLDTSQVNASLVDALEKVQAYQNAINEVNKLSELKEAGITIDDSQLQTAKEKVDECAKAIQGLDSDVKLAIGLEEDGSIDSIKKSFEDGKVKIDANTDPAVTKIEALAENVDRIEDKDITINVTVNGLDDVKELNRQINLATDIDGDINKLNEYVESAKALSGLGEDISSHVTANINGNVKDTPEYMLNNLKVFSDSAEGLKDIGSFTSNVTANINGNVKDTPEFLINNLKTFTDSAKDIKDIGIVESSVKANVEGNVKDTPEYMINNLKTYSDSAKNVKSIGEDVESKVKADIGGNVIDTPEYSINNLKVFTESAKDIDAIGIVESSVSANIEGNVVNLFEGQIDNLKAYSESAKDVDNIGNVSSKVEANINGNVTGMFESSIDNLKTYSESAKDVSDIGTVKSSVEANITGNVSGMLEMSIDNLKAYSENASEIENIGNVSSSVDANITGNVQNLFEGQIDNLKAYSDNAKDVQSVGNVSSKVTADVDGNVINTSEYMIDNLKTYSDNAKNIDSIGSVSSKATVDVDGNVIDTPEYMIDNLKTYTDNAKNISSIGEDVKSKVTANIEGNVKDTPEYMINNLKAYIDSAKGIKSIGEDTKAKITADVDGNVVDTPEYMIDNIKTFISNANGIKDIGEDTKAKITADVSGNVINTPEYMINNLGMFGDNAKKVDSIGDVNSSVSVNVDGNVISTSENAIDNIGVFASNAEKAKNIGNFTSSATANVNGNAITDNTVISDLEQFASVVSGLSNQTVTVTVTANVDSTNINNALTLLTNLNSSGVFKDYNATVQVGAKVAKIDDTVVQNYIATEKIANGKVKWSNDEKLVNDFKSKVHEATGKVKWDDDTTNLKKSFTASGTVNWTSGNNVKVKVVQMADGTANVNGSAFANGTTGKAYKHGDWGVKQTTTALTGELGRELVVYKNRYWTVGDNGAEFSTIPRGAIVFNHKQTEELFANGKVTSDGGRGRAFANGTAFIEGGGKFYGDSSGKAVTVKADTVKVESKTTKSTDKKSTTKTTKKTKDTNKTTKDTEKDFEETFDWVEIAIDRIERAIDELDQKANSVYSSWTDRNKALSSQISKVGDEIDLQQKAYNEYMSEANSIKLPSAYKKKVQNGTIDIQTVKNEDLAEKIKEYQQWYEKALDCKKSIKELRETEAELYAQRFEHVQKQYDGILQGYEHTETMLNEYISQAEESGYIVSKEYYQALMKNKNAEIGKLEAEQKALLTKRQEYYNKMRKKGMSDKDIRNSEQWIEMSNSIDEVTESIEECNTNLIETANNLREVDWEVFDLIQERISAVSEEADFLIELMSNEKLFDDKGKFTGQGVATMGLHAQKYNDYMYQADDYGSEIADIDTKIDSGEYDSKDQEVINRRQELLELQREMILAAEDEKNALRDLVEEGINLELDALQELIDKKNEELESEKNLYEYQKKVKEQTSEIASLEKQLSSYSGDDSEEAKAKIQELKVSLEEAKTDLQETEWDKYIDDTSTLLDNLYLEYENILNQRLDNVDFLLQQVVDGINATMGVDGTIDTALSSEGAIATAIANAVGENGSIKSILNGEVTAVGSTLSNSMSNIWTTGDGNIKSILSTYGQGFQSNQTTTNAELAKIKADISAMVDDVDKDAQKKIEAPKTTTSAKKDPVKTTTTNKTTSTKKDTSKKNTTTTKKSTGDGKAKVGDKVKFVSGKYYYDSYGKKPTGSKYQGKEVYITKINTKGSYPYHISTGKKLGSGDLGWLKLSQLSGYATGKKNFLSNEVAWTQENGKEFIVRPSDGAILTPIAKGDSVLNANASKNIWDMANSPVDFIKDNLNLGGTNIPNNSNVNNNVTQNFESVVFSMPNVHSYNELLTQMQKDKNFEKLVLSMSVDRLAGKSSLAKNKSIR